MKFLVAFVALVAVAAAATRPFDTTNAQLEAIVAAINSPSTDPATAALLETQLNELIAPAPATAPHPGAAIKPTTVNQEVATEVQEILQAIASPNTDPATAAALSEMLLETLGMENVNLFPIDLSPAIIDISPVAVINPVVAPVPVITPVVQPTPPVPAPAVGPVPVITPVVQPTPPMPTPSVGPVPVITPVVNPVPVITPVVNPVPVITPVVNPVPVVTHPSQLKPSDVSTVVSSADGSPLVQIILNINQATNSAAATVSPAVAGAATAGSSVTIVDHSPIVSVDPISVAEPIVVVDPISVAEPIVVVNPVSVAESIIPMPAVTLPEILN